MEIEVTEVSCSDFDFDLDADAGSDLFLFRLNRREIGGMDGLARAAGTGIGGQAGAGGGLSGSGGRLSEMACQYLHGDGAPPPLPS